METILNACRRLTAWPCRLLLLGSISALIWPSRAVGQTNAEDYFHKGAQYYIFGEKTNAVKEIFTGLRMYPSDRKLNEVAKLLAKKEPEDQNKSKNGQQNQDKQDQDQKQQQQDKKDQNQKDQKNPDQKSEQQKDSQQQKSDQGQKSDDKKDKGKDQKQSEADKKKQEQQAAAKQDEQSKEDAEKEAEKEAEMMAAGEMTPNQAKQLLDAAKDDDQILRIIPPNKQTRPPGSYKDW